MDSRLVAIRTNPVLDGLSPVTVLSLTMPARCQSFFVRLSVHRWQGALPLPALGRSRFALLGRQAVEELHRSLLTDRYYKLSDKERKPKQTLSDFLVDFHVVRPFGELA